GGHLRVVRLHAGLFVALLVAGGGVAADRQRGAVLHQVVGHVADITATDRDRAVVELRVPEVGDVPVPEVEGAAVGVAVHVHGLVAVSDHRVRHVSVGLHPGELPGVDRRLDVTPGEHRSVTGVDLTVVVTVDHHATAGGGVRDVVAGGDRSVAGGVHIGDVQLQVAVDVTVHVHVHRVVDVGGVVVDLLVDQLLGDVLVTLVGLVGDVVQVLHYV